MNELTQARLKELLHYNPDTGLFIWIDYHCRNNPGDIAGQKNSKEKHPYLRTFIDGEKYLLHRLAFLYMTGSFPLQITDHINRIRDDNRWINLRDVSYRENSQNQKYPRKKYVSKKTQKPNKDPSPQLKLKTMKNNKSVKTTISRLIVKAGGKKQLAEKLEISVRYIDMMLNGKPPGKHLYKIIKDLI